MKYIDANGKVLTLKEVKAEYDLYIAKYYGFDAFIGENYTEVEELELLKRGD